MKTRLAYLLLLFCSFAAASGQSISPPKESLFGCYEVIAAKWNPPMEDDPSLLLFPSLLRLGTRQENGEVALTIESVPPTPDRFMQEKLWFWTPEHRGMRIWFGTSLGGYRGTLKRISDGNYSGTLKEWCDNRCEWKKHSVKLSIRRISCSKY